MDYEDQLFEIFYQSQVRQRVELDRAHRESEDFRRSERAHFDTWRSNEKALWIVVERDGAPVGYAVTDYNPVTRGFGICNLGVVQSMRGQGVGTEIMQQVIAKARELGAASIGLTVHKGNAEAVALYEKMFFEVEDSDYLDMILKL